MVNKQLQTPIQYLHGIGPQKASILQKELNIHTIEDLLRYYPYRHVDRTQIYAISQVNPNLPYIQVKGQITAFETFGQGRKTRLVAHFTDGHSFLDLVWFNASKYIINTYKTYTPYLVFGKPQQFGNKINIPHPEIEPYHEGKVKNLGWVPIYNTTEKMKNHYLDSKALKKIIAQAYQSYQQYITETLPEEVLKSQQLISAKEALFHIHFPTNSQHYHQASVRLKFEELFFIQLSILRYCNQRKKSLKGFPFSIVGDAFNTFYHNNLPFSLTNAQKRVIKEIRADIKKPIQMNRLLQGDVGSGKTLVALMSMLIAHDNGYQSALMAPTEILATQHYNTFCTMLKGMKLRVELLTGSTTAKKRKELHLQLQRGDIHILVGTHALIEDNVKFCNLGMVVIDEQHRFGVVQRAKLWKKNTLPPHVLVMTATPIPRTLAMTVYGDLDVSVIDELPPGRKPIKTIHQYDAKRSQIYSLVKQELEKGRQAYVVYPLIEESDKIDLKNLEDGYQAICEAFPSYRVCKLHGKMKPKEKEEIMQLFAQNKAQIVVSTTVIEVGVNVPNASVMIIEEAQRFGLSQLHQLRGRVGRGAEQSFCILVTPYELSANTRSRMDIMVESNDGFRIAEADLKLRGPGDLEGTQQSGVAFQLQIASLSKDGEILTQARMEATKLLEKDPELTASENQHTAQRLRQLSGSGYNWSIIS